jgi:uncharacterized integral membrane protein
MRWLNTAVTAVLALAMLVFAVQNLQNVSVSFLNFALTAPLALVIVVVYLLGMATGGSLWALVRWAIEGTRRPPVR